VFLRFSGIELSELQAHLERAELRGIGLRRDEGFGYVAFNHLIYQELEDWHEPALNLERIQLGQELERYDYALQGRFKQDWEQKLNGMLKPGDFSDRRFEAVARLLYVSQGKPKDEIEALLDKMGEQVELLPDPLPLREKANYYKGDGQESMEQIIKCLDELEKLISEKNTVPETAQRLWSAGLQMLADHIAVPARQKAEEGR
jgi:CRISPR-associated protein Csx10